MALLGNLVYMLSVLGVGAAGRTVGVLTAPRRDALTWVAYTIALPILVFHSTYDQPLAAIVSPELVVGVLVVVLGTVAVAVLAHRNVGSAATRSTAVVQSYHSNLGFLGLPVVATLFGDLVAAKAVVILGVCDVVQTAITVTVLVSANDADAAVGAELRELATNPVLLALVAGLAASTLGVGVPALAASGMALVSQAALPIALLAVGASLTPTRETVDPRTVGSVVAIKVFVMPALAFLTFTALGAADATLRAGVTMVAMPAAVSTFVYANELGGDGTLASTNVFVTTVVSLVTVFLLLPVVT